MKKLLSITVIGLILMSILTAQELSGKMQELVAKADELSAKANDKNLTSKSKNLATLRKDFDSLLKECAGEIAENHPEYTLVWSDSVKVNKENDDMTTDYIIEKPFVVQTAVKENEIFAEKINVAIKSIPQNCKMEEKVNDFPWSYAEDTDGDNWLKKAANGSKETRPYTFVLKTENGEEIAYLDGKVVISYERKYKEYKTNVYGNVIFRNVSKEKTGEKLPLLSITIADGNALGTTTKSEYDELSKKLVTEYYELSKKLFDEHTTEMKNIFEGAEGASLYPEMVEIPGKNYKVAKTEVTQKLYAAVIGKNPSHFKTADAGENKDLLPVEQVSWYDAIYFCNLLSQFAGLIPVYSVDNSVDVTAWKYVPGKGKSISGKIEWNEKANGYRLPTYDEWKFAAKGGQNFECSGSDDSEEIGWDCDNSGNKTHEVAMKKPNGYGLYDMNGNVWEFICDIDSVNSSEHGCGSKGAAYNTLIWGIDGAMMAGEGFYTADYRSDNLGFRVVCTTN